MALLKISSWRVSAACMAGALFSQSLVEPSMSVNRNVRVPVGGLATTPSSSLLPLKGHYSSATFLGSFVRPSAWRRMRSPCREPEKASWATSSRPLADGLQYGLQYMEPGDLWAFTLPSTSYLQISVF